MYLLGEALIQPKRTYRNKSLFADERSHQNVLPKLTFAAGFTLLVVHSLSFRCFSWNQATRKFNPDPLAVTSPSQQALSTWAPLHELAHDQYHACNSQEEPCVNRTAKGNAGYEPRLR